MSQKLKKTDQQQPGAASTPRLGSTIGLLAALSGACGLAYEILFIRLFTNYFGDGFLVTGVTLCAVFLGMSFGTWFSLRLMRFLAIIEISIGLYAVSAALTFSRYGFEIAAWSATPWVNTLKLTLLLGIPAFLIGTCVPLFSAYARKFRPGGQGVFARVYSLYNAGAFLSVLAIEFWLFRSFGLQTSLFLIASLNFLVGASLFIFFGRSVKATETQALGLFRSDVAIGLFLASVASGIFQLFVLRVSFSIFGPLQENFAIILAAAIGGVAVGAALARRSLLMFETVTALLGTLVLGLLVLVPVLLAVWGQIVATAISDDMQVLAKVLLLGGFPFAVFLFFGTLVPLAVGAHEAQSDALPAKFLAISSLGNGIGALLMFAILYRIIDLPWIAVGVAGLLLLSSVVVLSRRPSLNLGILTAIVIAGLAFTGLKTWPQAELLLGYRIIAQKDLLEQKTRDLSDETTYKAFDQNASVLSFADGSRSLVFNGYHSLSFGPGGKSDLHETVVGATPALFTNKTERALVLGLGTGISAGATARIFDATTVVEINLTMLNIPAHFQTENSGVMTRSNVAVVVQDGISVMLEPGPRFDAIVNTVTTPRFYAASKLYTEDFLQLVKTRLSEGGVYSTWFDLNMDREGIAIMLNTLEASFDTCRYFVMTASYFNAVCADHELVYQPRRVTTQRFHQGELNTLFKGFGFTSNFVETVSALEVSFEEDILLRQSDLINTLDRPAIEFVVARQTDREATTDVLSQAILANIDQQRRFSIGGSRWKFNCRIIGQMSGLLFQGC